MSRSSRRFAVPAFALSAAALVAASTAPAYAHDSGSGAPVGTASATTAAVGLDVSLVNGTVNVPLDLTLNHITAPADKQGALLDAKVGGFQGGRPFQLVNASVGHTWATADHSGSGAGVKLVDASVALPGLPFAKLLSAHEIDATASCPADGRPTASAQLLGDVTVLGTKVDVTVTGPVTVNVPGVGSVLLRISDASSSSDKAAATALRLDVTVNPLQLNVAKITGSVVLAEASCAKGGDRSGGTGGASGGNGGNGGSTSGSTSGTTSGSTSGTSAGTSGGATSGSSSGTTSGTTSGSTAGSTSGSSAGSTAGSTAGNNGGATSGSSAGSTSGSTAGTGATATGGTGSAGASAGASSGSASGSSAGSTGSTGGSLASTGASSSTPLIAGGAIVAVGVGIGVLTLARRRRRSLTTAD